MQRILTIILIANFAFCNFCIAQDVPILNYSINALGQAELQIDGDADKYYLLHVQHEPNMNYETITSLTLGQDGLMTVSESLGAFPEANYSISAHDIANPDDTDGDGIDDMTELNDMPTNAPLNFALAVDFIDGTTSIPDAATFEALSVVENVSWAPFLNGQQFVKFGILDKDTDEPKVYFINSNTHFIHANFFSAIGQFGSGGDDGSGEIVFNPNVINPNGTIGSYSFNFSFGDAQSFESTQRTFELLAANMPFLENNLKHFIGGNDENNYINNFQDDYVGGRIFVELESEVFADIDFIPFNEAEGFGLLRHMDLSETPGSRDIVIYDALPNSLPRVGGIITSVVQTPLSHVNLRAIQDDVPNAYIKEPLDIPLIADLLDKFVYYRVEDDNYLIREASQEEVNNWYDNIRPTEAQIPDRDLSVTSILPLDNIGFDMANVFGAKCSNVATMRSFGFPEGTIPNGFGVPFYFYDEFMKFNGFYTRVEEMLANPTFVSDLQTRIDMLKDLRDDIKDAPMPQWMLDELQAMHDGFPDGTSVRCRSSTNNEDLPGFSGAGLYTSKTQHPDEGHIKKSIKQVYASMWNFRAFDERDFYRVDHFIAAMGVLCHPNFEDEQSNGVGVSIDPLYGTVGNFYINTQVGEFLITNPDANSLPEEILLAIDPADGYTVLRFSNLVLNGELVMEDIYINQLRDYLQVIHDEFAILYDLEGVEGFGMDIEYKVTAQEQLIIKQARPWVSFWADIHAEFDLAATEITAPTSGAGLSDSELVTVVVDNQGLNNMGGFDLTLMIDNQVVETMSISEELARQTSSEYQFTIPQDFSAIADYDIITIVSHPEDGFANNDTLRSVIGNLHVLEGAISAELVGVNCSQEIELVANVSNLGASTFTNLQIEVTANGQVVDVVNLNTNIPFQEETGFPIVVTENLQQEANEISLRLLTVNAQTDAISNNNTSTFTTDLDQTTFSNITLIINGDNYPTETTWAIFDESGTMIENDDIGNGGIGSQFTREICVDYTSCYTLFVYDSFGDGICCGFGQGNFLVVDAAGNTLLSNDGNFGSQAEESFCPASALCSVSATITTSNATTSNTSDGSLSIVASGGNEPYQYSINGGITFVSENSFANLEAGIYEVVVRDASSFCIYEEDVEVEADIISSTTEIISNNIIGFPNPTEDNFTIEITDAINTFDDMTVEVYNNLGMLIESNSISTTNNQSKAVLSMQQYANGSYIVKVYNKDVEKYFKVVKL